jgi:FAD synthase
LINYTRKEMKFSGLDALTTQLNQDRTVISQLLAGINPAE